jgi:hypothetical protein
MHECSEASGSGWDWHPDKILAVWVPGILRLRIELDVKARQTACACGEKGKGDDGAALNQLAAEIGVERVRQTEEAPDPGEDCWGDAEGNDIGQRIQLLAEVAGGVGEARDGSIPSKSTANAMAMAEWLR